MITKFLISLAYKIDTSINYKKFKEFTYNILENKDYKYKKYFDFMMIFLVLSTVMILIFEVNNQEIELLDNYEFFAIVIFIIEYVGRFWVYSDVHNTILLDYEESQLLNRKYKIYKSVIKIIRKKFEYISSPMAIVDLLAILPYYRP
jgi:voltage-gated potassium channel